MPDAESAATYAAQDRGNKCCRIKNDEKTFYLYRNTNIRSLKKKQVIFIIIMLQPH